MRIGRRSANVVYPLVRIGSAHARRTAADVADGFQLVRSAPHETEGANTLLRSIHYLMSRRSLVLSLAAVLFSACASASAPEPAQRANPWDDAAVCLGPAEPPQVVPDTWPTVTNRAEVGTALERAYVPLLQSRGDIQGSAQLCLLIAETGAVQDLRMVKSSGDVDLDRAAVSVARVMTFEPAKAGGLPVRIWIAVPMNFRTR